MSKVENINFLQDMSSIAANPTLADVVHKEAAHILGEPLKQGGLREATRISPAVNNLFDRLGQDAGAAIGSLGPTQLTATEQQYRDGTKKPADVDRKVAADALDIIDCDWGRSERREISNTVNKYFNKMDRSHWYDLGKDHVLEKDEILDFLLSDDAKFLSDKETADLVKAYRRFDEIKNSEEEVWGFERDGITRGDLWAFSSGSSRIYDDIIYFSKGHPVIEDAIKEIEKRNGKDVK